MHQVVPTFASRDAIGNHTRIAQRLLRAMGFTSHIYSASAPRRLRFQIRDVRSLPSGPDAWTIYQCSTGAPIADVLAERDSPVIVDYHNITPARLFEAWEPRIARELDEGRRQLARLGRTAALGLADSAYNQAELDQFGYRATAVAPVLVDLDAFARDVDRRTLDALLRGKKGSEWLFVGRIAPNKCQHDVLHAFAYYRRAYDPNATLSLVGGPASVRYQRALLETVAALGLGDAVRLTGSISDAALTAHYRAADVLVCLSEHEGFCVPLLEAMHHRLPIVAFAAAAVPEILADAGLCLPKKSPAAVAEAVAVVLSDDTLRAQLARSAEARLGDFDLVHTSAIFTAAIADAVGVVA
ncbi:MAG TPA: glycosyltransferase family 4 protein [Acidimicrobiales bacterium]|nr:glycosyltransferase family 4 protein [Acidimicrobiales bacterium]